jgi:hypothetical protein
VAAAVVRTLGLIARLPLPSSEALAVTGADALTALVAVLGALGLLTLNTLVSLVTFTLSWSHTLPVFKAGFHTNGCAALVSEPTRETLTRAFVVIDLTVDTLEVFANVFVAKFTLISGVADAGAWGLAMSTGHDAAGRAHGTRAIFTHPPFKALAAWVGKAVLGCVQLGVRQQGLDGTVGDAGSGCCTETVTGAIVWTLNKLTFSSTEPGIALALSGNFTVSTTRTSLVANRYVTEIATPSLKALHGAVVANEARETFAGSQVADTVLTAVWAVRDLHAEKLAGQSRSCPTKQRPHTITVEESLVTPTLSRANTRYRWGHPGVVNGVKDKEVIGETNAVVVTTEVKDLVLVDC